EAAEAKRWELQQQVSAIELEVRQGKTLKLAAGAGPALFSYDGTTYEALLAGAARGRDCAKAERRETKRLAATGARTGRTPERRRYMRVAGPFDGRRIGALETQVLIYDLSEGGCFVIAFHDQEVGRHLDLRIELPQEGSVLVKAETVYNRPGFGFAVRFIDLN